MHPLKALIFDVDGTLADTERDGHRVAFNAAFAEAGLDWNWDVALYGELLAGWQMLSDAPFNAFVDVYRPGKWGSWGALRHLGDDNPRWQALAKGCTAC